VGKGPRHKLLCPFKSLIDDGPQGGVIVPVFRNVAEASGAELGAD